MARFYKFLYFVFFFILMTACQNEENIGDFYGQWALRESSVSGVVTEHDNLYISFQGRVVWAKSVNAANHTYNDVFGGFSQQGDSVFMYFIQQNEYTSPKSLIEEKFGFENAEDVRLLVKNINHSDLLFVSGNDYWKFEKF